MNSNEEIRYIVDVKSSIHQKAIDYKLSYVEGVILNDIAFMEEKYGNCTVDSLGRFLHIDKELVDDAIKTLCSKNLTHLDNDCIKINKYYNSIEDLRSDNNRVIKAFLELAESGFFEILSKK